MPRGGRALFADADEERLEFEPLMPAKAGIQGKALGPRFRGDERQ
jgi:hypothetical protein